MNPETRTKLIEVGARVIAARNEWSWDALTEAAQEQYRLDAAAVIGALGIEAVPHPFEVFVASDGMNAIRGRTDLFSIRAAEEGTPDE